LLAAGFGSPMPVDFVVAATPNTAERPMIAEAANA